LVLLKVDFHDAGHLEIYNLLREDNMLKIKELGKKILAVTLAAAMLTATGCGNNNTKTTSDSGKNEPTATTAEATPESSGDKTSNTAMTKISVYRPSFNTVPDTAEVKAVQDAINAYIGDKINVEIQLSDISSSEYFDKANLALANNEIDLLWTANWAETIKTDDLVKRGALYDITDKLPNYDIYKAMPEWVWGSSGFGGKNYFIPCYKEAAEGYNLMFRKALVDKYGWDLSTVKSLKDIEPMLEDLKAEGLKYPYLTQKTAMFFRYYLNKYDFFSQSSFIAVDKDQDAVVNTVASPEYLEFASLMGDWAAKGYISEDDLTKTTTDTTTQTQDWGISWWTDVPNNGEANNRYKQDVEMVKITDNWTQSNGTLGATYAISATSTDEEVDACLKFLGLLYTDTTLADLYTFGIEGTDYTRVDGKIQKTEAGLYNHSAWESTTVTVLSLEVGEPDDKIEMYTTFNDGAKGSIANGFRFDKTNIDAQYAACESLFDEFAFALENGGIKPADVPAVIKDYQKALDDAGYQEILKEAQTQYEEWKKVR
jgi:putative aldouronate transport system substrate-binding protein